MVKNVAYVPLSPYKPINQGGIIEQPKFMPSYYEYLRIKGEQIVLTIYEQVNGYTSIYQIPLGYTLFLTSLSLSITSISAAAGNYQRAQIGISSINTSIQSSILNLMSASVVGTSETIAQNFTIPLSIEENKFLMLVLGTTPNFVGAYASFSGFLVKNADISV